jgi:hypothetical protein
MYVKMEGPAGIASRLAYWRKTVLNVPLREIEERVNKHLEDGSKAKLSTIHGFETTVTKSGKTRPSPRAEWIAALKQAYPYLNLDWLLFGRGEPTIVAEEARKFEEMLSKLPEPSLWSRMPTYWLGQNLPTTAMLLVAVFLKEAETAAHLSYGAACARGEEPGLKPTTLLRRLERKVGTLLEAGFDEKTFVSIENLSDAETTTYVMGILASIRLLFAPLRPGSKWDETSGSDSEVDPFESDFIPGTREKLRAADEVQPQIVAADRLVAKLKRDAKKGKLPAFPFHLRLLESVPEYDFETAIAREARKMAGSNANDLGYVDSCTEAIREALERRVLDERLDDFGGGVDAWSEFHRSREEAE